MWTDEQRERYTYEGKRYASDLTDAEWNAIEPLLQDCITLTVNLREMINGRLYLDWTGCPWRALPKDFGPHTTVLDWDRRFRRMGLWERISNTLREPARAALGRSGKPSTGLMDSQSVKGTPQRGPRGTDGNKRVRGIKRHVITCSAGLLIAALCTPANVHDAKAAVALIEAMPPLPLTRLLADSAYSGPAVGTAAAARAMTVEILPTPDNAKGFTPLPLRWRVEATFGSLTNFHHRLGRNWEQSIEAATNSLWVANARRVLRAATRKI